MTLAFYNSVTVREDCGFFMPFSSLWDLRSIPQGAAKVPSAGRPPQVHLEGIAGRFERGDFSGRDRILTDLVAQGDDTARFCDRIRQHVRTYGDKAISGFITLESENG